MVFSYISHLYCPKCSSTYDHLKIQQLCICGSPLLVEYKIDELKRNLAPEQIQKRSASLWRYHELLPISSTENVVSLGEGMTPLVELKKLSQEMNIENLLMKDEGLIPTGSFKARGATVGVSKAKELGIKKLAMPTNGNAGAAWSLYSARADIKATIVMPIDAPKITREECAIAGADLFLVNGLISDAGKIVGEWINRNNIYDASTLKEPYRIEGKKTMGFEIAEQLDWKCPDVIVYPTGGGVGLIGIYKAFKELIQLGWLKSDKLPRLVAVQADGCAPIVKAWEEGKHSSDFWPNSSTKAFGINVPKAIGDFLVLDALYNTDGYAISVSDQELFTEQRTVASLEGTFICPEGAAAFSAIRKLRGNGWIKDKDKVVVLNTGAGIKYPDSTDVQVPILQPDDILS
ncbi:threonine synthase [Aquibacillus halophilus]|uniref:Threonine synthase n=1 Tax=Aquibacillus halophilus TaxID=930132 RepID=A0A6A8DHR4_9BACI|nr:threonine synthase [Aquibacillus halophilus]MRH44770.1 threonine synthase [Aquibacillus halophilus]